MPELTVVIPTKDRPTLLPRALSSVLDQVGDAQVVVVDDGSTSANASLIRNVCLADPRVDLVRNETAHGSPHARNQGLALAEGRFWATLDDDDIWLPGKWREQRLLLEATGPPDDVVVVTALRLAHRDRPGARDMPSVRSPERFAALRTLFDRVSVRAFCHTFVAPTTLLRAVGGFDERLVWGEYTDLLIRLSKTARFAGSDLVGAVVDKFHGQASSRTGRDWTAKVAGIRLILEKHHADFEADPLLKTQYLHVLGVSQLRGGDRWAAAGTFREVVVHGHGWGRRARAAAHLLLAATVGSAGWRFVVRVRRAEADV